MNRRILRRMAGLTVLLTLLFGLCGCTAETAAAEAKQYNSSQKPTSAAGDTIRAAAFKSGMFWSDMAEAVDA